jgi:cell division septal protein FtsQ
MPLWNFSNHRRIQPPKKKRSKSRGFFNSLIFVLIVGAAVWFLLNSSLLNVKDIKITGIDKVGSAETHDFISDSFEGTKIYSVEKGVLTSAINEKFPNLKLNEIKYKFPNTYEVNMSEREEKYVIQAANGTFIADDEGFVLGAATEASPSADFDVIYDRSLEVGKKIEDASLRAALIYSDLNQTIKVENGQIQFNLENGGKIILPESSAVSKVSEFFTLLQKIIQKYTIENKQVEFIDLRFSKPVIKY